MKYQVKNTLTAHDVKQHIPHPFEVSPGYTQLELTLHFSPAQVGNFHNMLTLSLFDPTGFRGAGHRGGNMHRVALNAATATPGYLPGPLPPGTWLAQIDTHLILQDEPCRYTLEISIETGHPPRRDPPPPLPTSPVLNPRPGWYRGDLHAHSHHSDADWTPAELVKRAQQLGWDFVTLTDHNTISSIPDMLRLTGDSLLTLVGMELTTFRGHALCLGARHWIDWRITPDHPMAEVARQVIAQNQIFVIAHPRDPGDPYCTGCDWQYPDVMPGPAGHIEVWNHVSPEGCTDRALALWYIWLNQGYRLVATTGSDAHFAAQLTPDSPCNVVYAEALSEVAVWRAIRQGRLYLSRAPQLEFTARTPQSGPVMMGDTLTGSSADFTIAWTGGPDGAILRVIAAGRPLQEMPIGPEGNFTWQMSPAQARWCLVEIRDQGNELLALTNPIYLNRGRFHPELVEGGLSKGRNQPENEK